MSSFWEIIIIVSVVDERRLLGSQLCTLLAIAFGIYLFVFVLHCRSRIIHSVWVCNRMWMLCFCCYPPPPTLLILVLFLCLGVDVKKNVVVTVSSDKGLCGGINSTSVKISRVMQKLNSGNFCCSFFFPCVLWWLQLVFWFAVCSSNCIGCTYPQISAISRIIIHNVTATVPQFETFAMLNTIFVYLSWFFKKLKMSPNL